MKIYPSENASSRITPDRLNDPTTTQTSSRARQAAPPVVEEQPVPEIRKQLLAVQRTLGRYQRVLGGLEGFKVLLRSDAKSAADYIAHVRYRGEAVLEPYSVQLNGVLQRGDAEALGRLIQGTRAEIHGLSVELSRLETAEQNSRSLSLGRAALSGVLEGIRRQGDQLLNLEGKNVLDLLG
jgi:hypothetical protein